MFSQPFITASHWNHITLSSPLAIMHNNAVIGREGDVEKQIIELAVYSKKGKSN